jgi:hypothetical protein
MPLPVTFANLTNPTLPELDQNFAALGALVPIPCTVSGTNTITMTPAANTPTITALAPYTQFSGVVNVSNTGATTINAAGLGALSAYKDTPGGPVALAGGEMIAGNAFTAMYDPALNGGAGGFHVYTNTFVFGSSAINSIFSRSGSITFSVVAAQANQTQNFSLTGCAPGDIVVLGLPAAVGTVAQLTFTSFVAANGSVSVVAVNSGSVSVTPPSGLYRVAAIRILP